MPSVLGNTPLGTSIALESDLQQSLTAVTGKPYDAECEYVTVPVGAYFMPGAYSVNAAIEAELVVELPTSGVSSSTPFFCGNWRGDSSRSSMLFIYGGSFQAINFSGFGTTTTAQGLLGDFITSHLKGNVYDVASYSSTISSASTIANICDFGLGACAHSDGNPIDAIATFAWKIKSFKFHSSISDIDAIPVRLDGVGYLYDKITGRFIGSATSTALVPGPDASTPTYTPKTEIDLLAPLASPAFTGTPTAPTAASGTNTTQLATTAFVQGEISGKNTDVNLSVVSGKVCITYEE